MFLKITVLYILVLFNHYKCFGKRTPKETHFPGYHYCGPGTKYLERIARGELGVNKLDEACRSHDYVYTNSLDLEKRMDADIKLEHQAWQRVLASDSSFKEKIAAWMVTNVMKVKRKLNSRRVRKDLRKKKHRGLFSISTRAKYLDDHHSAWL